MAKRKRTVRAAEEVQNGSGGAGEGIEEDINHDDDDDVNDGVVISRSSSFVSVACGSSPLDGGDLAITELSPSLLLRMDAGEFLSDVFRRKVMHVKGGEYHKIPSLRGALRGWDARHLFHNTSSESGVHVWLMDGRTGKLDSMLASAEDACRLHAAGHATYCRAPREVEQPLVARFLRDLGLGCGRYDPASGDGWGRGEVEVFCGTKGHFTDWHFDFQENFTVQLEGVKRWKFVEGTVKDPLRGATPHYKAEGAVEGQLKAVSLCFLCLLAACLCCLRKRERERERERTLEPR